MRKVKLYDIDDDESEVFKISLVDEPAVNIGMVYLSEDKPKSQYISLSTDEKHMIYACALRCNYPIYRYDGENEYYIRFSQKTVESLARKFMQNGFQNEWSTDHSNDVDGLTVVESWIVSDSNMDKTKALNMDSDIGVGDWIVGCYVDNDDVWERVKNGDFGGFSVEAFCNLEEVKKFSSINMEKENNVSFLEEIKNIILETFASLKKDEEKEEKCEESTVVEEELPTEEVVEEVPTEEIVEEVITVVEEVSEEPQEDLQAIIDALQEEVDALKNENEELKKSNEQLSKTPSVKKINVEASSEKKYPSFLDFASGRVRL